MGNGSDASSTQPQAGGSGTTSAAQGAAANAGVGSTTNTTAKAGAGVVTIAGGNAAALGAATGAVPLVVAQGKTLADVRASAKRLKARVVNDAYPKLDLCGSESMLAIEAEKLRPHPGPAYLSLWSGQPDEELEAFHVSDLVKRRGRQKKSLENLKSQQPGQALVGDAFTKMSARHQAEFRRECEFDLWKKQQEVEFATWHSNQQVAMIDWLSKSTVPAQGDWLTFPLKQQEEKVVIPWTDGLTLHSAEYYRTTCWWGKLSIMQVRELSAAKGETDAQAYQRIIHETARLHPYGMRRQRDELG